jgi:hypothetical protein
VQEIIRAEVGCSIRPRYNAVATVVVLVVLLVLVLWWCRWWLRQRYVMVGMLVAVLSGCGRAVVAVGGQKAWGFHCTLPVYSPPHARDCCKELLAAAAAAGAAADATVLLLTRLPALLLEPLLVRSHSPLSPGRASRKC